MEDVRRRGKRWETMFYGEFAEEGIEGTIQKMRGKEQICGKISDPPLSTLLLGLRNGEDRWSNFPIPSPSPKWASLLLFQPTEEEEEEEKRREKWSSRKKARDFPENKK